MADPAPTEPRALPGSFSLQALLVLAIAYTAHFTAAISIPIVASLLLYFLFAPVVQYLTLHRVPRAVASFGVSLLLTAFVCLAAYTLTTPAIEWLDRAPASIQELRTALRDQPNPLENIRQASDAVEDAVADITDGEQGQRERPTNVRIVESDLVDDLIQGVPRAVLSLGLTLLLTAFLLLYGKQILRGIVSAGGDIATRRRILETTRQIETGISRYLGTVTLINTGLALVVAGALYLLGLPNPLLWGVVAGLLNYAPYLGPMVTTLTIALASIEAMTELKAMMLPPLLYLLITAVEGQIVTPLLVGRRLKLSPIVVLLSVVVMGWLWGLVGALMAVPLVASLRICLVNLPGHDALGKVLERNQGPER